MTTSYNQMAACDPAIAFNQSFCFPKPMHVKKRSDGTGHSGQPSCELKKKLEHNKRQRCHQCGLPLVLQLSSEVDRCNTSACPPWVRISCTSKDVGHSLPHTLLLRVDNSVRTYGVSSQVGASTRVCTPLTCQAAFIAVVKNGPLYGNIQKMVRARTAAKRSFTAKRWYTALGISPVKIQNQHDISQLCLPRPRLLLCSRWPAKERRTIVRAIVAAIDSASNSSTSRRLL